MPINIQTFSSSGSNVYAVIARYDSSQGNQYWNTSTTGWVGATGNTWYQSAINLSEHATGHYFTDYDTSSFNDVFVPGVYRIECWKKAGTTASPSSDTLIGAKDIAYDGILETTDYSMNISLNNIISSLSNLNVSALSKLEKKQLATIYSKVMKDINSING